MKRRLSSMSVCAAAASRAAGVMTQPKDGFVISRELRCARWLELRGTVSSLCASGRPRWSGQSVKLGAGGGRIVAEHRVAAEPDIPRQATVRRRIQWANCLAVVMSQKDVERVDEEQRPIGPEKLNPAQRNWA